MDLVAAVETDEQSPEVAKPGEGALDDPADAAQPGAVLSLTTSDLGADPAPVRLPPVLVMVVAAVGGEPLGPSAWPADLAAHRRDALDQRE